MSTARRATLRRRPLSLSFLITLGAAALLAVLITSLAPAQAAPPAAASTAPNLPQAAAAQAGAPGAGAPDAGATLEYAPGVVLVKLKTGAGGALAQQGAVTAGGSLGAPAVAGLFQSYGVTGAEPLLGAGAGAVPAARAAGGAPTAALADVYRLHLAPELDAAQMALALAADPNVAYAEPDYIARAARVPDDPEYAAQWALAKIGAPAAWDVQTGSPDVLIAVIDSGVDLAHPEFAGRLWENDDPVDGVDNDLNGFVDDTHGWNVVAGSADLSDASGHGTQVGGVLGAAADNGVGIAGLCWGCKLMFVNAMQASGAANYSDIARAVIYASSNGAQVINLSLGGYADSALLAEAIREASTTAVIVGGAGNDDSASPFYPAAYPQVLAVAATDQGDKKAIFSNYGAWVDLAAPGVEIRTTTVGGYATDSGASLAAAYASGLAGLVKSQHPQWTPEQVKWQMLNTAAEVDAANAGKAGQLGRGRIDAAAALAADPQAQMAVASYAVDGSVAARPAPGQSFQLVLNLQNQWLPAQELRGTLASSDPHVQITDAAGVFGDIQPGQIGGNAGDPFGVTVAANTPYNTQLAFTLQLSGAGGYQLALPVTLGVRSAVETLGNTQYSKDTVWTNDKTYVLAGSIIVREGVTLTIQPGAVVKAEPDKFIRVDGTLIAAGTAERPILFTTNSATNAVWGGIRFTPTALDAVYNGAGTYTGGSILRHVEVRRASVGASLAGRAPYIADSTFADNGTAIATQADGAPGGLTRIERSRFENNRITADGGATILQNTFSSGQATQPCGISLSGGSPLIMQNTFNGAYCGIEGSAAFAQVISNTVRGSGIYLSLSVNRYGGSPGSSAPLPPLLRGPAITQAATGNAHTCAVLADGGAQCWGNNEAGQLGTGASTQAYVPQVIVGLGGAVTQIAAGSYHTCALLAGGSVQCWGYGAYGRLGTGNDASASTPQAVVELTGAVTQVAAGSSHTCAVLANGSVQCWGYGGEGQLGDGNYNSANKPQRVAGLAGAVRQIAAGSGHTCAVLANGGVQCWGNGASGQLGDGRNDYRVSTPRNVEGLAGAVTRIAAGGSHTCAVLMNGGVQCWGNGGAGQLGGGNHNSANRPQAVAGLAGAVTRIAAGSEHTCAVLVDGGMQCWGAGSSGQLGDGDTNNTNQPRGVVGLSGAAQAASGGNHTCAVLQDGSARCWGNGSSGQLGAGSTTSANRPQALGTGVHILGNAVQRGGGLSVSTNLAPLSIRGNSVAAATGAGLSFACDECQAEIVSNTVAGSQGSGMVLGGSGLATVRVRHNNLVANGAYDLYLNSGAAGSQNFTLDAAANFWGVAPGAVAGRIRDCTFDENGCGTASATVGKVAYTPALDEAEPSAPAFVRLAALNPNPVGLEPGTVTVDFSRPMNTGLLPSVTFHDSRRGAFEQIAAGYFGTALEDGQGRLWFGGLGKLLVFDGQEWMTKTVEACPSGLYTPYSAGNGDLWVGYESCSGVVLSRLRGATWTTYTNSLAPNVYAYSIRTIAEDSEGNLWFGTRSGEGAIRFDGRAWRRYTTEDGLASNSVLRIVRGGQGRLWFLQPNMQGTGELSAFDGSSWTTYGAANGYKFGTSEQCLFADRQGRIWVCGGRTDSLAAMFDGSRWTFFDSQSTGGILQYGVSGFAESSDGSIWVRTSSWNGGWAVYRDGAWSRVEGFSSSTGGLMLFDRRDNLWLGDGILYVRWGGLDYPFENGRWLSPTRYQAGYGFTPSVLPGAYVVEVDGAAGEDGLPVYAAGGSFRVDFGAGVSLQPPPAPRVLAQTDGALTNLSASWQNGGAGVDQYRYSIGSAPGARDVVGWTYLAATSFTRSNLNLVEGQTTYVTVQARSTAGLWSASGVSNRVVAGTASTPVIQPDTGGAQTEQAGALQVTINVPPGAVLEPTRFTLRAADSAPDTGGLPLAGPPFTLEADTAFGDPVTQFAQPLTLVIRYTDESAAGLDETRLQIFFWNEAQGAWVAIPTTVDAAANTLTTQMDHLTLFAALQLPAQEQRLYLPSINR